MLVLMAHLTIIINSFILVFQAALVLKTKNISKDHRITFFCNLMSSFDNRCKQTITFLSYFLENIVKQKISQVNLAQMQREKNQKLY